MITFKDMVALMKKVWWKIGMIAVFFGALAGIAGLMLLGKTYTARAVMFINIEKIEFSEGQAVSDLTDRMIGRTKTVVNSDDYFIAIKELGGSYATIKAAEIKTDATQGSIAITLKSTTKGIAQKTADAVVSEQMKQYIASKITDKNVNVTSADFTVVSTPVEDNGTRGTSPIILAIGACLGAFIVTYLVWLAVYDYKKKPEEKEAETPAE